MSAGYDGRYRRIYRMLKGHGHSAAKAIEIIIGAKRRDRWALAWIKCLRTVQP